LPTEPAYLAFYSGKDRSWTIGVHDMENQVEQVLTEQGRDSSEPDWSCDGSRLAFTSNMNDHSEIYVADFSPDWFNNRPVLKRLTHDGIDKGHVAWSPDGRQLAYVARPVGEPPDKNDLEIYVIDIDKPYAPKRVTYNDVHDLALDWSCTNPAGLIFESGSSDAQGLVVYMVDPNNLPLNNTGKNLTREIGWRTRFPSWSCDGTKIAYHASPDGIEDAELFIMDADGKNHQQLTDNTYNDFHPAWSPDGKQLVFTANGRDNNYELYIMEVATREVLHRLTNQPSVTDRSAVWRFGNC
jgi:TolB protein